jgi:transcriptional regulator with XRE-family HTH domain
MVGPQVKRLRVAQKLTQPMLAARCNLLGWGISRETLAKIEARIRWVADFELICLSSALNVPIATLLPDQSKNGLKAFLKL